MAEFLPRAAPAPALVVAFTGPEITGVRHAVAHHAAAAGLWGDRLHDFVLAVNEIVSNAVLHGGGGGELRLWGNGQTVECAVIDAGPGGVAESAADPPLVRNGHGLRFARLLVDDFAVRESPEGTTVHLVAALPAKIA